MSLFDPDHPPTTTAVAAQRDDAIDQVERNADADWLVLAWDTLVEYLRTHEEFFVDDFWADTGLEAPREARALGAIVRRASRERLMEKSGRSRPSVRSHLSDKPIWSSLLYVEPTARPARIA